MNKKLHLTIKNVNRMKKLLLFSLSLLSMPLFITAQTCVPVDTMRIYYENFDGAYPANNISQARSYPRYDWEVSTLYSPPSPNNSLHLWLTANSVLEAIFYTGAMNGSTYTPISSWWNNGYTHLYLDFTHICQVMDLEDAHIIVRGIRANNEVGQNYDLSFSNTSYAYKGNSTSITSGNFAETTYSEWAFSQTSTPNATWWKNERILLTEFQGVLNILNDPLNIGIQIGFTFFGQSIQQAAMRAGWFIDNISLIASKTELEAPEVTLTAPLYNGYSNVNARNNIGPYIIKSEIKDYSTVNVDNMCCYPLSANSHYPMDFWHSNDVIPSYCIDSLQFFYTRRGTDSIYNSGNYIYLNDSIISNLWAANTQNGHQQNKVNAQWRLPKACYGDTITYTIKAEDIHGNVTEKPTTFVPWGNPLVYSHANDAELISIDSMPYAFVSDSIYPIKVTFKNKSDNRMKSVDFQYTVKYGRNSNGVPLYPADSGTCRWEGNLCRDWTDTITIGYFTARRGPDTICVRIVNRNDDDDDDATNNLLCYNGYACDSILVGDYIVGGTGPNVDFATLTDARLALEKCGIDGHVRLLLHPGTYSAQKFSGYYHGQGADATITIMKNPDYPSGDVVFIDDNNYNATILLDTTGYFIFQDLVIQGKQSGSYSRGFFINGGPSNNITIRNCQINVITGSTATNYAGIVRSSAVTTSVHNFNADDNLIFRGNVISGGSYGIYYIGSSARRNILNEIDCNTISSSTLKSIYLQYANGMSSIDSNNINNGIYVNAVAVSSISFNSIGAASVGIELNASTSITSLDYNAINAPQGITTTGTGIAVSNITANNITATTAAMTLTSIACGAINANKITTAGKGLSLTSLTNNNADILVSNNEIKANIDNAANYAVTLQTTNNLKFINNAVHINSTEYLSNSRALHIQSGTNMEIKNNILYNTSSSQDNTNYPIYIQTAGTGLQLAYNNYYSIGGKIGFSTIARNNMAEWIYAYNADTNSQAMAIPFAPNLLQPDTCTGLECPVYTGVQSDILGANRGTTTTMMGAYHQSKNSDIAIVSLLSPSVGLSCPSNTMPIIVKLKNTGSNAINFAATNVNLVVTVTTAGSPATYSQTLNSGTLAPLSTMDVVVAATATFPLNDTMDIRVIATLSGDMCADNDSLLLDNFILKFIQPPFYEECFYNVNQCNPVTLNPEWTFQQVAGNGNWIVQEGEGVQPTIVPVYGTGRLFFNSRAFANNTESRAVMPLIKLSGSTNPVLEFWMAHDNVGSGTASPGTNGEGVTVQISTDGGQSWTDLTPEGQSNAFIPRYVNTSTPVWTKHRVNLTSHLGNDCILIGFKAKGRYTSGNNINIDRVVLKDRKANDLAIENIYALGEDPVSNVVKQSIKVRIANEGSSAQTGRTVTLDVSGANTYTQNVNLGTMAPDAVQTITMPGQFLVNPGLNTVKVFVAGDNYTANDTMKWNMESSGFAGILPSGQPDTTYILSYTNDATCIRPIGGTTTMKLVNRFVPETNGITVQSVRFYPVNEANATGKRVRGFVSNGSGETIATTDIYTLSSTDIDSWVELPINNYTLTGTTQAFYVGIEMIDPGYYIGTQIEAPIRDSAYYYMNGTTYTPLVYGRTMIGARVHKPILTDIAILSLVYPDTACDMKHDTITIQFTQNSIANIAANTVTFNYAITNDAGVTTTVSELYPTMITAQQTHQYTFNALYDFTNNSDTDRVYQILIWVNNVAGDIVFFNDTLRHTLVSHGKAAKPVVVSPHTGSYYYPAVLSATEPTGYAPGEGIFAWYTMAGTNTAGDTLWNLEGRGNPFTTFTLFYDTTFYTTFAPGSLDTAMVGTGNTDNSDPMRFTNGYSRGRILYPQSAVGRYGQITEIALNVVAGAGTNGLPIKIYIKQVSYTTFPNTANNWANEIAEATLVYDGNMPFNTAGWHSFPINTFYYTEGSLLILTETNCGGTNCQSIYGSTTYPKFKSTTASQMVQYVVNNNTPPTGNFTSANNRWNMRFQFADMSCQSQKVKLDVVIPDRPTYDILTVDTLFNPIPNTFPGYCTMGTDSVCVKIRNLMPETIPANKVVIKAAITGYKVLNLANANSMVVIRPTTTLIDTLTVPVSGLATVAHTFSQLYDFSAYETDLQSIRFDIVVSTDLINEVVYRANDTVRFSVFSKQTDAVCNISVEADNYYTLTYTAAPNPLLIANCSPTQHTMFYFYANETSTSMLNSPGSLTYQTPALFDTVVYWVAARNAATTPTPICTTKRFEFHINVKVPQYDLKTTRLSHPISTDLCALNWNAMKPKVVVKNTVSNVTIPANTFKLVAQYVSGSTVITGNHVITTPINPGDSVEVEFGTPLNLASTTENRIFNYKFFTEPVSPMYVYALNDTISGTQYVPASPVTPSPINASVPYGQTYTVVPSFAPQNMFTFYNVPTGGSPLAQGTSFTTDPVYTTPTTYYYSGQINDVDFMHTYISGTATGTNNTPLPFAQYNSTTGANTQAQAKILYTVSEYEWLKYTGRIDTIAFQVMTPATDQTPVKIYIKNANNATSLTTTSASWATDLSGATLIFDEATDFLPTYITSDGKKWFSIAIPGGFNYDGTGIMLFTEQTCDNATYSNPAAQFRYTTLAGRMVTRARTATGNFNTTNFSANSNRWHTKFVINNACESGRGTITLTTTVPAYDLEITELTAPTSPAIYTNNETITVKIKNHSNQAASGFSVAYHLADSTPIVQPYSGSIAAGAETTFSFTNADLHNVYMPTNLYTYIVWNNDQFHNNDTLITVLEAPRLCISRATDTARLDISNVTFAGIDNGPGTPIFKYKLSPNNGLYTDYSTTIAPAYVVQGQTYPIRITGSFTNAAPGYTSFRAVYIDLDRNNQFTDAERVYYSGTTAIPAPTLADSSSAVALGEITIPLNASLGLTKMRVIASQSAITSPCLPYTYGETEDYAVLIEHPFSIDMAITKVMHPDGDICADHSGFIKVKIKNYGTTPMSFATYPLQVNAKVTGASTQLYSHTVTTGNLAPNQDTIVEIPNVDYSVAGTYNIKAYLTKVMGDDYQINDTSVNVGVVQNTNVATIPYFIDFEPRLPNDPNYVELNFDTTAVFPAAWKREYTSSNFQWKINMGIHHNTNVSGPAYDHTTSFADGQYAVVRSTGSVAATAVATLTTNCIDMHHDANNYPKILSYYEHVFGAANANIKMYVQIGSGKYYETVDSIIGRTHTSDIASWINRQPVLMDFDENARIRFVVTGHTGNIDPAIDDLGIEYGKPDISLERILTPIDTICVRKGQTLTPRVVIRNTGQFPVYTAKIYSQLRVGAIYQYDTVEITWPHATYGEAFMPGESISVQASQGFEVPYIGDIIEFMATTFITDDSNPYNNVKSVQTCTVTDIKESDYDNNGIILGQNIPNPAGNKTIIPYILPETGRSIISIYSIEGQQLHSAEVNGTVGENSYEFDVANFADGVYIYTLQFKGRTLYKKMVVRK